jgi:hypothetical protein
MSRLSIPRADDQTDPQPSLEAPEMRSYVGVLTTIRTCHHGGPGLPEPGISPDVSWKAIRSNAVMAQSFLENPTLPDAAEAEVVLLLLQIRQAHNLLDRACANGEPFALSSTLQQVTDIYGSVKGLLPKLKLPPAQGAYVSEQLTRLRMRLQRIATSPPSSATPSGA